MLPIFEHAHSLRLTETEQGLLAWFEAHPEEALHQNLGALCGTLYTSNATIVRFCQKLGLSGYNDFKYQLRRELRLARAESFYPDEYISRTVARFQDTVAALDLQKLEEVAALLTSDRPLYIYGTNLSTLPARYLQMVLHSLDHPSVLIEWRPLLYGIVHGLSENAVLLVITAKGRAESYLETFRLARERQVQTILLTCTPDSPLIPYSTITICTNDRSEEYHHTDINPRIGFFTVIQLLIELISPESKEAAEP